MIYSILTWCMKIEHNLSKHQSIILLNLLHLNKKKKWMVAGCIITRRMIWNARFRFVLIHLKMKDDQRFFRSFLTFALDVYYWYWADFEIDLKSIHSRTIYQTQNNLPCSSESNDHDQSCYYEKKTQQTSVYVWDFGQSRSKYKKRPKSKRELGASKKKKIAPPLGRWHPEHDSRIQ